MTLGQIFQRTLLAALLLLAVGCSSNQSPVSVPYSVTIGVELADDINPYGDGSAHPLVLRLYQLTELGGFQNAEFLDLYNGDRKVLSDSLVDVLSIGPLTPGTQRQVAIELQREARFLGVMAEFADYGSASSKAVIKLSDQPAKQDISIRVSGLLVSIVEPPKRAWWQIF